MNIDGGLLFPLVYFPSYVILNFGALSSDNQEIYGSQL